MAACEPGDYLHEGQPDEGQPNELEGFLTANGLGNKILVACEKADYNL